MRLLAAMLAAACVCSAFAQDDSLLGFAKQNASAERSLEQKYDSLLDKNNPREFLKRLSAHPHHVGSKWGLDNANYMLGLFKSWGYDAHIEEFQVLFPTPKERLLELNGPNRFVAKISEPAIKEDATSKLTDEELPPYNAYSADGDVTAKFVYVNYGMPKDYDLLASKGIDVKGRIAIARYGGGWRGLKPKLAAEHGAVGCLIYSDPRDDGYYQGDVYPKGPMRNGNGVQRGSVADMPIESGDPLTPGYGATKDAKRIDIKDATLIMKIPVMPISYGDVLPFLQDLGGETVPDDWRGALPITYHFGPSANECHLKLKFNWDLVGCRDVIAKLPGSDLPDEWIIRGNHHDGWVAGAQDPLSGCVSLLEGARAIGELAKTGWRPKRTLIFCCWDGEEPGLLGSTEWVETHLDELARKGAVYINSDTNGRGFLRMGGSHSLEAFINQVAKDVVDPEKAPMSVWERAHDREIVAATGEDRKKKMAEKETQIDALGSGSDYTPFLQHAGVSCLSLEFGGENPGGIYHSVYDSFDWYTKFDDGTFDYSIALAKVVGHTMLRLGDADVLPFEFKHLASRIGDYVTELAKLTDKMRDDTLEENKLITQGITAATLDPKKTNVLPKPKPEVPYLNFAPLQNALAVLQAAAVNYDKQSGNVKVDPQLDEDLIQTERAMLTDEGLPKRPWYKHMFYAPGLYTGYGVKTLPGVREAIEQREWDNADTEIKVLAEVIHRLSERIKTAAAQRSR